MLFYRLDKRIKDDMRCLQNKNHFLNEEVKRLAKLKESDKDIVVQRETLVKLLWSREWAAHSFSLTK